jgi:hypothetical protein
VNPECRWCGVEIESGGRIWDGRWQCDDLIECDERRAARNREVRDDRND